MTAVPSKVSLLKLHEDQLSIYGSSTKEQKDAILGALGGADEVLKALLTSNALINDEQLKALHQIISNPRGHSDSQSRESKMVRNSMEKDKGYKPAIKMKFYDRDMLLFTVLNRRRATKIRSILYSTKTNIFIFICLFLFYILPTALYAAGVLSWNVRLVPVFFSNIFLFFYSFGWILTANKEAMKLICREFVFLIKMGYLLIWLATDAGISYLSGYPVYYICAYLLHFTALFTLIMITDALNISQTSKIMLTIWALGVFAGYTVFYQQSALHQSEEYSKAVVFIPGRVGFDSMRINVVDICANAVQILALFSLKQIYSSIHKPNKASLIKISPLVIYEDGKKVKDNDRSHKNVKMWRRISIGYWSFVLVIGSLSLLNVHGRILLLSILSLIFIIWCSHLIGSSKALYVSNKLILLVIPLMIIGSYLFEWNFTLVSGCFFGFGCLAVYTVKVKSSLLIEFTLCLIFIDRMKELKKMSWRLN